MKVTIAGIKPPVWRRLVVPSRTTLAELHDVMQAAFGWWGYHLHEFDIGGVRYGSDDGEDWDPPKDERRARLDKLAPAGSSLRGDNREAQAALSRQGRYRTVTGNLGVKEVVIDDATMRDRFVVCHNPEQAARDRYVRDQLLAQLTDAISASDQLTKTARAELVGYPGLKRFLRTTTTGLLRVDHAAVRAEERLDGKFLLRASDPTLSAEDFALGYKQLLEVERGWRDMRSTLDLRPVYHHLERRIRAHVLLCWLGLLLIRLVETATGDTWRNARHQLERMHQGTFTGPAGTIRHRTATLPEGRHPARPPAPRTTPVRRARRRPHHRRLTRQHRF